MVPRLNRRELLAALLGVPVLAVPGCGHRRLPPAGELLSPSIEIGHRIRDGFRATPSSDEWRDVAVVIVGGGIAGLSAAWRFQQAGYSDFVVFELEPNPGGTSQSGQSDVTRYPWGAHYLPVPAPENRALIRLLDEMGILEGTADDTSPVVAEQYLCRDPAERLYYRGQWIEGLYPYTAATQSDLRQLETFRAEVNRLAAWRDEDNRRAFAIPIDSGSDDPQITELDEQPMASWLTQHGLDSPLLRWLIDYSCRDDYGLTVEQASAWAGLFYFAARIHGPDAAPQPLITWPEGNGRIVDYLARSLRRRLRTGQAVLEIIPPSDASPKTSVVVMDVETGKVQGIRADRVIFAAPQFLAPRLIRGYTERTGRSNREFQYGSWLVANVHLRDRPRERGFPLCWDNVIYESRSLGYVVATHQSGLDYGPTVLTWYYPICDSEPAAAREWLLDQSWELLADLALADLEVPHPGIRDSVVRLDVMRWGHAMIQPQPGFVWSAARRQAARPDGSVHFAGTDLSGVALMEEAFYHGARAAEEVMARLGSAFSSFL